MKSLKIKFIFIMIVETLFLILLGILLNFLNLFVLINLIIYILLIPVFLWGAKILYNLFDISLKSLVITEFILLGVFYFTTIVIKEITNPTNTYAITYEYLMGNLALNGFLGASKCSKKEQNAKCLKYIGVFLFFVSILIGILALFGFAR